LKFWRKIDLKRGKRNGVSALPRTTSRRATPRRPAVPRLCAHAEAPERPPCRTRAGLGRCHAATADSPQHAPPSAIGRRLRRTSPPPRANPLAPVGHTATEQPPRHTPGPIKPPLLLFLMRPSSFVTRRCPPLAPPTTLLLLSPPLPTNDPKLLPSTHSSFHVHGMA
jgi:hypothetical protein